MTKIINTVPKLSNLQQKLLKEKLEQMRRSTPSIKGAPPDIKKLEKQLRALDAKRNDVREPIAAWYEEMRELKNAAYAGAKDLILRGEYARAIECIDNWLAGCD